MKPTELDPDLVLRIAQEQAVRWKRTLELLADAEAEEAGSSARLHQEDL